MPARERHQVLEEWNATAVAYPQRPVLARAVRGAGGAYARGSGGGVGRESLTYGELNARANRLARHLRSLDVGPDVRVGICVERSVEMVVGLLGTLKAGGAMCRWTRSIQRTGCGYMLEDSAPAVVLIDRRRQTAVAGTEPST